MCTCTSHLSGRPYLGTNCVLLLLAPNVADCKNQSYLTKQFALDCLLLTDSQLSSSNNGIHSLVFFRQNTGAVQNLGWPFQLL